MKYLLFLMGIVVFVGAGCTKQSVTPPPYESMPATTTPPPLVVSSTTTTVPVVTTSTPVETQTVKIFLVALGNGQIGQPGTVGCGDTLIPVNRVIPATTTILTAALRELLSLHEQLYGQAGLYNPLYQSHLRVDSVVLTNQAATVRLSGTTALGGECDTPRVMEQLKATALQFPSVTSAVIFINNERMEEYFSLKG